MDDKNSRVERKLRFYDKINEREVESILLVDIPMELITKMWEVDQSDPMYYCYRVDNEKYDKLSKYFSKQPSVGRDVCDIFLEADGVG